MWSIIWEITQQHFMLLLQITGEDEYAQDPFYAREFRKSADEIESALYGSTARGTVSSITHNYAGSYTCLHCAKVEAHAHRIHDMHLQFSSVVTAVKALRADMSFFGPLPRQSIAAADAQRRFLSYTLRICANDNAHALLIASTRKR